LGPSRYNWQTRLFGHEPDVLLVTKAARLGMGQAALVAKNSLTAAHARQVEVSLLKSVGVRN
jgi:hypothetical protein